MARESEWGEAGEFKGVSVYFLLVDLQGGKSGVTIEAACFALFRQHNSAKEDSRISFSVRLSVVSKNSNPISL